MLTSSHAAWTWLAGRGRRGRAWAVLGAVVPDLPALVLTPIARARGIRGSGLWQEVYHRPGPDRVHRGAHSLLAPLALALVVRRPPARRVVLAWIGHVGVDVLSHRDDAWAPLWPVSARVWRSPVSYWQREAGGLVWASADCGLLALAALRAPKGPARAGLGLAAALAAGPLIEARRADPWGGRRRACAAGAATDIAPRAPRAPAAC